MPRIALAQINTTVGDLGGNTRKIIEFIDRAKAVDVDIVAFPELAICGYPPEDLLFKKHFIQDSIKHLKMLKKHTKGIVCVVGCIDADKMGRIYNAAATFENGKLLDIYHKHELPNYGVFDEKRYFTVGETKGLVQTSQGLLGISVCEDLWVEKGVHQNQQKADVMINLSSSPYDVNKYKTRESLLVKRAKQARTHYCYVNLVGGQDELVFDGGSLVVDPKGKVVTSGKLFAEDLACVDIKINGEKQKEEKKNLGRVQNKQLTRNESVYEALVLGTRDYVKKNGFKKVLVGLSGGIDSALVAAIARDAIGDDNVIAVTMPSHYTSKGTLKDAKKLAKGMNIQLLEFPITSIFHSYLNTLEKAFSGLKSDTAEENLQARIRGNILMALSNKFGWLVLATGNKSEFAVGYCTLYGDMSGGFAVLKDVPKTQVYEISRLINSRQKEIIPQSIIDRPPSAELRANQKDQDSLPSYEKLDHVLRQYVEEHKSLDMISRTTEAAIVAQVTALIDLNEYKRRQSPPGIKITPRAFGKDWRLPITNKYK